MKAKGPKLSDATRARIVEVFNSIQGEGLWLGQRHVFTRFGGCNLHCDYCDEPDTIPIPSGEVWSDAKLKKEIERLARYPQAAVISWTGGEPLLHAKFLAGMMEWARKKGFRNYLETNGLLVAPMKKMIPLCDMVAMDIKLPSATGRETWSENLEFLHLVAPDKAFAKVVLTAQTTEKEWRQVIRLMQEVSPKIPLILQPATPFGGVKTIEPWLCLQFMRQASALLKDVRLSPQWHPVWKLP